MGSHLKDDGNDISPSILDDALYNKLQHHDTYILISNLGIDVVIDVDSIPDLDTSQLVASPTLKSHNLYFQQENC
ncbi:hypothetical protein M378DRAFT_161003 [Amanita muscaria Koide BX008]|uniref:Uncharacterized protein n=1 Tax=Amanita muscaria (strain Koide BX008) TaxID=946122 RepID=A0A0C2ST48_AMAMK|nr:hypothetical protein M378DRAFT_161003 [Amanita muscaria Koide BX008]